MGMKKAAKRSQRILAESSSSSPKEVEQEEENEEENEDEEQEPVDQLYKLYYKKVTFMFIYFSIFRLC